MINREERECFNILDSTIKQAAHKLLDVGKTVASATECWGLLWFENNLGLRWPMRVHQASEHLKCGQSDLRCNPVGFQRIGACMCATHTYKLKMSHYFYVDYIAMMTGLDILVYIKH